MAIMHERIKEMRNERGITLLQIAEFLNVTEATAQRYETGKGIKTIPYEVIEKYAQLFNCDPAYIMGWEEVNKAIKEKPAEMAERHIEMIMDEDINEIYDDFKKLDPAKKQIVKDLVHSLAKTEA